MNQAETTVTVLVILLENFSLSKENEIYINIFLCNINLFVYLWTLVSCIFELILHLYLPVNVTVTRILTSCHVVPHNKMDNRHVDMYVLFM